MPAVDLAVVVSFLDRYLRIAEVADAAIALNGLQVANGGTLNRAAAAVDLCDATVQLAAQQGADLLLVHHGLFWGGLQPLTGRTYRRVAGLIKHNIALYSAHLPLDVHPEVGNNAVLAQRLGVARRGEFGEEYGMRIGVWGVVDVPRAPLAQRLGEVVGGHPRLLAVGPERVRRVGIVTGAAGPASTKGPPGGARTPTSGGRGAHTVFGAPETVVVEVYTVG